MFQPRRADAPRRVLGKQQRWRRWWARLRWLGKGCLAVGLSLGVVWSGYRAYLWVYSTPYFRLKTIHITGQKTLSEPEIRYLLGVAPDTTLLQLDLPRIGARLERHPYIRRVAIQRMLPDTLNVVIEERDPLLAVASAGQSVVVDSEGVALRAFVPEQDAAFARLDLRHPQLLEPGMHLRLPEVQRALEIVQIYRTLPLASSMRLVALSVELAGASVWEVAPYTFKLRVGEGDIAPQLEQVPQVLRYIAQQGLALKSLDVSYRKRFIAIRATS